MTKTLPKLKPIPRCKGERYHVFGLGEGKCSLCGWDRYDPAYYR